MRTIPAVLAAVLLGFAPAARAAYTTPSSKTVVDFQPSQYEFGDTYATARTALSHNGYNSPIGRYQTSASYTPSVGYGTFHAVIMNNNYGVWLHASHGVTDTGGTSFLGLESYPDDSIGLAAATNQVAAYQSYYSIPTSDIAVCHEPGWAWYIGINAPAIDQYRNASTTNEAFVFASACDSYGVRGGWWAKAFAGYNYQCPNNVAHADADAAWNRMDGSNGRTGRSLGDATAVTTMVISPTGSPLVLAPAISGFTYAEFSVDGTITFDSEMDKTVDAYGLLTASGSVSIPYASWSSSTAISYGAYCNYDGSGSVTLNTSSTKSTGGISLNPDGVGTRTETYGVGYQCAGGINPAAAVDNFVVTREGPGNRIRWTTDWESGTAGWSVQRITDGAVTVTIPVAPQGGSTAASYDVTDPTGQPMDRYRLVEHQAGGGRDLTYGEPSVLPAFTPVTVEPMTYDPATVQATLEAIPDPSTETPAPFPTLYYAIVCPDSFATTAQQHADLWISRGVDAEVIRFSDCAARGGIKNTLAWLSGIATRAAVLIGDASDSAKFAAPWPTGWTKPAWPLQAGRNLLPSYYTDEPADSPSVSLSYFTPYYASDLPYADTDNDGLPDLLLGRIPAATLAQYQAYVAKLATFLATSPSASWANRASQFVYAVDFGTVPGDPLAAQAESLALQFPPTVQLSKMIDRNGPTWTTLELDSIANAQLNAGRAFVHIGSTNANRSNYAFWALQWGWTTARLAANNAFPVFLATSCDMADFDRTENPDQGTPMCERLLFEPNKGAIAIVGPTRGTFQLGNVTLAEKFLDAVFKLQAKNIGTAFLEVQRSLITQYPQFVNLARSYVLLGDPLVAPLGAPAVTAVGDSPAAPRTGLAPPSPNPFNPSTTLAVHLAARTRARLAVYDITGRLVRTLADRILPAGATRWTWNGTDDSGRPLASGVYFARLTAPAVSQTKKLVLLK